VTGLLPSSAGAKKSSKEIAVHSADGGGMPKQAGNGREGGRIMRCGECSGSGACDPCDGYGTWPESCPNAGDGPECEICDGTGRCPECAGTGETRTTASNSDHSGTAAEMSTR
jgi:hypothetical protein